MLCSEVVLAFVLVHPGVCLLDLFLDLLLHLLCFSFGHSWFETVGTFGLLVFLVEIVVRPEVFFYVTVAVRTLFLVFACCIIVCLHFGYVNLASSLRYPFSFFASFACIKF